MPVRPRGERRRSNDTSGPRAIETGRTSGRDIRVQTSSAAAAAPLAGAGTAPPAGQAAGLAIFTICSNNYAGMARILISTAQDFHPGATLYLCLVDTLSPDRSIYPDHCQIVPAEDLPIPNMRSFLFRYDIMELNTAVKPFMFQHLIALGHTEILYFDPDIQVFAPLDDVVAALQGGAAFALTPHLCQPAEDPAFPDDLGVMRAGIYNLGFLGVHACAEAERILDWWARRLEYQCVSDQANGIFVDQKFMDLVPGFTPNVRILHDTTLNAGYWNLVQRDLAYEDGTWTVDGRPLRFYHFSGFNPARMRQLSKHTKAFRGDAMGPALVRLLEQYAGKLRDNGHGSIPAALYAYGRFASGNPIPLLVRKMFRERHPFWSGDPFESYEAYVHSPMAGPWAGSASAIVTNLMGYLHSLEPGLQHHFDLATAHGVRHYAEWYVQNGEVHFDQCGITEPVAERLGRRSDTLPRQPPPRREPAEEDVNVVGYLQAALGIGEAGRQTLRSLRHAGLHARGLPTSLNSSSRLTDHSLDAVLAPEANGRFTVFNINCDQLPMVARHLKQRLRPDSYRIMVPFWELSNLPDAWLDSVDEVDEIWAPTGFVQATLVKKIRKPVLRMPLMLAFDRPARVDRDRLGLPEGEFLFFFAFDYFSFIERKNPMAVVAAFRRAFRSGPGYRAGYRNVRLVLKTLNRDRAPEPAQRVRDLVSDDPDIVLIETNLSREDTLATIAACDAVISLHRSEGLGLLVAEAMVLGKPVISTDYSATKELVTPRTGWPVDFTLVPVPEGGYPFHEDQVWADADVGHAAWQMRRVVGDQDEAEAPGRRRRGLHRG